tara:strand:+ start:32391 stop:33326 length:936 start_codon:yes stop_codon:yes gene_type:complete
MDLKDKLGKLHFLSENIKKNPKRLKLYIAAMRNILNLIEFDLLSGELAEVDDNPKPTQPKPTPTPSPNAFSGSDSEWGVAGDLVAIPKKYHDLGQKKNLASFEKSPILIQNDSGKHFFTNTGKRDGTRYIYKLAATKGQLEVLWDTAAPWRHEVSQVDFSKDGSYNPQFKTVTASGHSVNPIPDPVVESGPSPSGGFGGNANQWGVKGNFIAVPDRYHRLGQRKRLSSSEKSPILIEINHHKYFLMPTGRRDGSRHIYTLPKKSGELKVLWDRAEPWRHEFARVNLREGANDVRFRSVDRHGRSSSGPSNF